MARYESPYRSQHSAKLADRLNSQAREAESANAAVGPREPTAVLNRRGGAKRRITPPAPPPDTSITSMRKSGRVRSGLARAAKLSPEWRREIARAAARKRWG